MPIESFAQTTVGSVERPRRRGGRPTLEQVRKDPDLAARAVALRREGRSWSAIAQALAVSRTSARRLCERAFGAPGDSDAMRAEERFIPGAQSFSSGSGAVSRYGENRPVVHGTASLIPRSPEELRRLPRSLRLFAELLRRVAIEDREAE